MTKHVRSAHKQCPNGKKNEATNLQKLTKFLQQLVILPDKFSTSRLNPSALLISRHSFLNCAGIGSPPRGKELNLSWHSKLTAA